MDIVYESRPRGDSNVRAPRDLERNSASVGIAATPAGSITLDGDLTDWTVADQIDQTLSLAGYDIYAKASGGFYVFAVKAPVAIGANTTLWLNTDQNAATGHKIWGFAGGAEYNVDFDATGTPHLYTGDAGETLVPNAPVSFEFSEDRTVVEFAISSALLGSPRAINTLWDINNNTFLPTDFSATQFEVVDTEAPPPVVGSVTLDGSLADWADSDQVDDALSVAGYDIYAKATEAAYVFALKAPVAIGANTTAWLDTDQNSETGFRIFGFAGGAEYNVNFDERDIPRLYTGDAAQTLVEDAQILFGYSADRTVVEFSVPTTALGGTRALNTLWDINNTTFLPTDFLGTPYEVIDRTVGTITLDGDLGEWNTSDQIDKTLSVAGYDIYGKATGGSLVLALSAPGAIGPSTTGWLNTDQNTATGFQIFGSTGGAEYNVNFDATGTPRLYTGDAGQTLVPDVTIAHAYSADGKAVELAIPLSAIGNPAAVDTLWDVNNSVFLPTDFAVAAYEILNVPERTDTGQRIGIVYSQTTAEHYFSEMAYSQLFMAAQNQAWMAGVPFDVLTESDLTDLSKIANYDALVFPSFSHVQANALQSIASTLTLAVQQLGTGLIAAGNFMTNDETGAALAGDSYARMKALFGLEFVDGGTAPSLLIRAGDVTHPMMQDYVQQELIHTYANAGWLAFAPLANIDASVLATQSIGNTAEAAVLATTTGGRNVHFSTDAVLADRNLLWQAIDYSVNGGTGVTAGLQLSRNSSIVASRTDMDQAMELFDVVPEGGPPGIYDKLLPILREWKTTYNFVGSYFIDIGDNEAEGQATDWSISGEYYRQLLAMGNELGSHSISHPHVTDTLTPAELEREFRQSKAIIEQQMSEVLGRPFTVDGLALPGAPESLPTALAVTQYYDYVSGGFSSLGAGYPGAFGFLTPQTAALDKVYLAPNFQFDFSLVEFRGLTPAEASAEWQREWNVLTQHAEVPVLLWPWHDYGAAVWPTDPPAPSPYDLSMYTHFIARAHAAGSEFVTLGDLAQRISAFNDAGVNWSVSGNVLTATITSSSAGKFALDLDNLGAQRIASVSGWYAYDEDSVFLPRSGGSYAIELGSASADVTHIVELPMRAELVSLTGNGTSLSFSIVGEGKVVIDLADPAGRQVAVTGGAAFDLNGDELTIDLGAFGQHDISVTFASNQAPTITSDGGAATATVSVQENATAVTTVKATDPDAGQTLTYAINGGTDAGLFAIDANTGALIFKNAPDFEAPADADKNNSYIVHVQATDNGSPSLFDMQVITVEISDVPENVNVAPTITSNGGGATAILSLAENKTAVTTVTASDPNAGQNLTFSIAGGADAARFAIDADKGTLAFKNAPDFEAPADADKNNRYVVQVAVTDDGVPNLIDTQTITVDITDVAENTKNAAPAITSNGGGAKATVSVEENTIAVTTVKASDPDSGQTLAFSISGGTDAARFAIDSEKGTLTFKNAPDFEAPSDANKNNAYIVEVRVADNGSPSLADVQTITVNVTNVAENAAPRITSNGGGATASVSVEENTIGVTRVRATDPDRRETITYSIDGGDDAAHFRIDGKSGVLTFRDAPDFEQPRDAGANNVYDVVVAAHDAAGATDTQSIAVSVTNVAGRTINAGGGSNRLTGTNEEDRISGQGGNDTIDGRGGDDTLRGGAGNDRVSGGPGDDILEGGGGNDWLSGEAGNDRLTGGSGADRFVYNTADEGLDVITDFTLGRGGDKIDIADALIAFTHGTSDVAPFVRLSGGADTVVSVNADGKGADFVDLVVLEKITLTGTLLDEMIAEGNLLVS